LKSVKVVSKLVELTKRGFQHPLFWHEERRGDAVELGRGVLLDLAVRAILRCNFT
jgi:hypothetical protein